MMTVNEALTHGNIWIRDDADRIVEGFAYEALTDSAVRISGVKGRDFAINSYCYLTRLDGLKDLLDEYQSNAAMIEREIQEIKDSEED